MIPAFNAERWLDDAVRSVLGQTYADLEVVVVDDGSTDDTRAVVESFKGDARVGYVWQENRGLSAARNAGIRASRGRYIALLDADDLFKTHKLSRQVAVLEEHPEIGLLTCGYELIDESGALLGEVRSWRERPEIDLRSLLFWNPLLPSTLVIRRAWCDRVGGFDESLERYEDWEYAVRLAHAGCRIQYVREVLVAYRRHQTNVSTAAALVPVATEAAVRFMTRFFDHECHDLGVRQMRRRVFGNLYLDAAARAYGADLGEQGRLWLEQAIEFDSTLLEGYPPTWLDALCGHALTGLVGDRRRYARVIATHQPRGRGGRAWKARQVRAHLNTAKAFDTYGLGHRQRARIPALQALLLDPGLLRNRGLLAVMLRPW